MGRAMLIICAGMLVALGIVAMGTSGQGKMLTEKTVEYAQKTQALNAAHTAIQISMQKINKNDDWAKEHDSSNPWINTIDDVQTTLYVDYMYEAPNYWDADSLRLVSKAEIDIGDGGSKKYRSKVVSVYLKAPFSNLVPKFESAITVATDQIYPFTASGSASLSGTAPAGSGCEDKPAFTMAEPGSDSAYDSTDFANELSNIDTEGTSTVSINKDLSYEPTDELIARLEDSPDRVNVGSNYQSSLGTESDPGVFFIEDGANLTGAQSSGYGIMVVKSGADLKYDGELKVAGNFEWNGLIVFENAYDFKGRGTPTINGSVLIGNTSDYEGDIEVDISGNIHMQYDCTAEEYAKKAAANAVKQNKYSRVVTLEETTME